MTNIRTLTTWLVLLFCTTLSVADSSQYLQEAKKYLADGEIKSAVIQLKNALQEDPANIDARLMLGQLYLRLGDGASAEKELKRAIKLRAGKERWQLALGQAYLLQRKYDELLSDIEPDPTLSGEAQAAVLTLRGQALLGKRQLEQAQEAFEQVLAIKPGHQEAALGLARADLAGGNLEQGQNKLDRLLGQHPDNVTALILRAELARQSGAQDRALADFDRALELQPANLQALLGRVAIHLAQRQFDLADKDLAALEEKAPGSPILLYLRAVSSFQQRDFTQAEADIQQVLEVLPNHPQSQLIYGAILFAKGELALADQYLSQAATSFPGHLPTIKLMAAARMKLNQTDRALETLEPAVERYPEDAQLLAMLGNAYLQVGRFQEGSELLSQAVAINPELAALRTQLAFGLLAQGNTGEAITELQTAVDLGQDLVQADVLLVLSHLRNKEIDQALEAGQALEKKAPDNPVAFNLTGLAYLAAGERDKAEARFLQALAIDPKFVTAEINLARLELEANRPAKAREHFQSVLSKAPENMNALIGMAMLAERDNDRPGMYDWLAKAQQRNPKSSKPGILLVQSHLKDGDTLKALQAARELVATFPDQSAVLRVLGLAQLAADEASSAVRSFEQLVEKQPAVENQLLLARAQVAANNETGARQSLLQALSVNPGYLPAQMMLTSLDLQAGNHDAALQRALTMQQEFPQNAAGFELAGAVQGAQGEPRQAISSFEQAYAIQPSAKLAIQLARLLAVEGDAEAGVGWLEDWLERVPGDNVTRTTYGILLQEIGRQDDAISQYEKILAGNPENVLVLNNLAWLYQEQGDKKALTLGEKAYQLAPKRPEIVDTYGWILVNSGLYDKGLVVLQEALLMAPDHPEIGYHVAFALHKAGRSPEAVKALRRIVRDHPNTASAEQSRQLLSEIQ